MASAVQGPIHQLIADVQRLAVVRDVDFDSGNLVQQAWNAGQVEDRALTCVPLLVGQGIRFFDHLQTGVLLQFVAHRSYGQGMLQVMMRRR